MSEKDSEERKKKLAEQKAKINQLGNEISAIESDHAQSMQKHKRFLDPKNKKTRPTKASPIPSSVPSSSTTANLSITSTNVSTTGVPSTTNVTGTDISLQDVPSGLSTPRKSILRQTSSFPLNIRSSTVSEKSAGKRKPRKSIKNKGLRKYDSSKLASIRTHQKSETKVQIDDDDSNPNYILKSEATSSEDLLLHVIEVLFCLEELSHIFIQRLYEMSTIEELGVSFPSDKKVELTYQFFSIEGELLYLMEQKTVRCTAFIIFARRSFENTLYDVTGNKVLKFRGPIIIFSKMISSMSITDAHDHQLGYVKTFGSKCNYSVYNARGERLFLVLSNTIVPSQSTVFTVLCRGKQIGLIKTGWKHTYHELAFMDYETSGVEFPVEMDEREKALLMGCMILIEFKWYSPITKTKISAFIGAVLLIAVALAITVLPLLLDPQDSNAKTRGFFTPNEIANESTIYLRRRR